MTPNNRPLPKDLYIELGTEPQATAPEYRNQPIPGELPTNDGPLPDAASVSDSLWIQFALGLTIAAIQVLVTVLFVDRIIARREAKRIRPTQDQVYARIFDSLDRLIFQMLPVQARKRTRSAVAFGTARAYLTCDVDETTLEHELSRGRPLSHKLASTELEQQLARAKTEIAHVLQFASPLLPSTVLAGLLRIESFLDLIEDDGDAGTDESSLSLRSQAIEATLDLRDHLLSLAEKTIDLRQSRSLET
jgi:hypothetical protein